MRNLSAPPPSYVPKGWQGGGFRWIRPWSQLLRAQNGRIAAGSPNGLHYGAVYRGPVPSPNASRVLQSGSAAPSATLTQSSPGVQSVLPISSNQTLYARPTVIGPQ